MTEIKYIVETEDRNNYVIYSEASLQALEDSLRERDLNYRVLNYHAN